MCGTVLVVIGTLIQRNDVNVSTELACFTTVAAFDFSGVVFVTDGAKGAAKNVAIEIARRGGFALVGVKSEVELRSLALDKRKGLEGIIFDIADTATLVPVINRIRLLEHELSRPLTGVLMNLAGT